MCLELLSSLMSVSKLTAKQELKGCITEHHWLRVMIQQTEKTGATWQLAFRQGQVHDR